MVITTGHFLFSLLGLGAGVFVCRLALKGVAWIMARVYHVKVVHEECCDHPAPVRSPFWRWMKFPCPACKEKSFVYRKVITF